MACRHDQHAFLPADNLRNQLPQLPPLHKSSRARRLAAQLLPKCVRLCVHVGGGRTHQCICSRSMWSACSRLREASTLSTICANTRGRREGARCGAVGVQGGGRAGCHRSRPGIASRQARQGSARHGNAQHGRRNGAGIKEGGASTSTANRRGQPPLSLQMQAGRAASQCSYPPSRRNYRNPTPSPASTRPKAMTDECLAGLHADRC